MTCVNSQLLDPSELKLLCLDHSESQQAEVGEANTPHYLRPDYIFIFLMDSRIVYIVYFHCVAFRY